MKLSKIDLSSILAVGHYNGQLGLLIDRGEEIELIEVSAPEAAYDGLKQIEYIVNVENDEESNEELEPQEPIAMLQVDSTMANAIGYDAEQQILQIEFTNGSVYQYSDVEAETWDEFQEAESIGRFFNYEIKGNYDCHRLSS